MLFSPLCRAEAPMTPAQALTYTRAGDLHFSPDGTKLAYVAYTYAQDYAPHLWLADVAAGTARDVTPAKKSERSPQWSPDGKSLAFLSNRGGKTQVYVFGDGDVAPLTAQKKGVQSFHWSPNGKSIAYLAQEDNAQDGDSGPQISDSETDLARLWVIDVASKAVRRIGKTGFKIDEFQWRDTAHLLIAATDTPASERETDAVYSLSLDGTLSLVARPPQPFGGIVVSPDGAKFAVRSTQSNGPRARDLFVGTVNDLKDVSAPIGLAIAEVRWSDPSAIWVRALDGFFTRIYRITAGMAPARVELPLSVEAFDVSRGGTLAYVGGDFTHRSEIFIRAADGSIRQLGDLQRDSIHLTPATIFKTKSFDGTEIESALLTPPGRREKFPLVLLVHGGPSSNFSAGYGWETAWAQMLASHGYQVLLVNPRGSNGYSEDFLKANRGDWGGGDYKDLMAVLDAVIAQGHTDPARLGIGGWSYGGEMTAWAIGQSDRFKAAVSGAPVYDQAAEFETEGFAAGDEWYFGTPWEHPDVYARNSPSTTIGRAHTPTLIFDGLEDANNPVGQSKGLYRALKYLGVETQMVLYPGEDHSPKLLTNNLDMFQRILDWYDGHLKKA